MRDIYHCDGPECDARTRHPFGDDWTTVTYRANTDRPLYRHFCERRCVVRFLTKELGRPDPYSVMGD